jgi:hypothetical protein
MLHNFGMSDVHEPWSYGSPIRTEISSPCVTPSLLHSTPEKETKKSSPTAERWPSLELIFNPDQSSSDLFSSSPPLSDSEFDDNDTTPEQSNLLDKQMDFLLVAAARRLCDFLPYDTLHCEIEGETWRCAPVGVCKLCNSFGVEKQFVKFSHLSDVQPTPDRRCSFRSPNGLVQALYTQLIDCERLVWFNSHTAAIAERRTNGVFISMLVDASYLIVQTLQHFYWQTDSSTTLAQLLGYQPASDDDMGLLFLEYLFTVAQQRVARADLDAQVDRLLVTFRTQWKSLK